MTRRLPEPVYWTADDPARLARDIAEVEAFAPDLVFEPPSAAPNDTHHGRWAGILPVWPFDRSRPRGIDRLVPVGLRVEVDCSAAHPMVPPMVLPVEPEPLIIERSQHDWHVAPSGHLCLMQSVGDWTPTESIADLLIKACGWHIEYALMKAGVITAMTTAGIVSDDSRDHLVTTAASRSDPPTSSAGEDDRPGG